MQPPLPTSLRHLDGQHEAQKQQEGGAGHRQGGCDGEAQRSPTLLWGAQNVTRPRARVPGEGGLEVCWGARPGPTRGGGVVGQKIAPKMVGLRLPGPERLA